MNIRVREIRAALSFWVYCFIALAVLASTASCSFTPRESPPSIKQRFVKPIGNPNPQSIHFYMMGEAAMTLGDLPRAYQFFSQADVFDPDNVTVKERILEALFIMAEQDSLFYGEMISLGEKYIENKHISPIIYRFTGVGSFGKGLYSKGLDLLKLALELDPDPYSYYDFFLYQARYKNRIEFQYLEMSLNKAWSKAELVYAIAQIYEFNSPLRSKEILEKAHYLYGDAESFEKLFSFYRRFRDWQSIVALVEEEFQKGRRVEDDYKVHFLEYLFFLEEYEKLLSYYPYFKHFAETHVHQYFFISAYYSEEFEKAIDIGKTMLGLTDSQKESKQRIQLSLAELYITKGDYVSAASFLNDIQQILLVRALFVSYAENEGKELDLNLIIHELSNGGMSQDHLDFLKISFYLAKQMYEKAEEIVWELSELPTVDDVVRKSLASSFLEEGYEEISLRLLDMVEDPEFRKYSFLGNFYYFHEQDSLAVRYLMKEFTDSSKPLAKDILVLAAVLNRNQEFHRSLDVVAKGVKLYPDDAIMLNWYGYTMIIHTDRYDEAEKYLLTAISLAPDNHHIQDSLAWLYYKKSDYEKALSYMEEIIANELFDNSVITYHIGMIYYELSRYDEAKKFLKMTISLNNDEESVVEATAVLKKIGDINE